MYFMKKFRKSLFWILFFILALYTGKEIILNSNNLEYTTDVAYAATSSSISVKITRENNSINSEFTPKEVEIDMGNSIRVNIATPSPISMSSIYFKSENTDVVTVSAIVTGSSLEVAGYADIKGIDFTKNTVVYLYEKAKSASEIDKNIGSINITVNKVYVNKINISSSTGKNNVRVGNYLQLTADVLPKNATNKEIQWSSNNKDIVVDSEGKVQALATGSAIITALAKDGSGVYNTINISTIPNAVTAKNLTLSNEEITLLTNSEKKVIYSLEPSNIDTPYIQVTSSEEGIVMTDTELTTTTGGSIAIYGLKAGNTVLTVKTLDGSNLSKTINVIVEPQPIKISNIAVKDEDISIAVGTTYQVEVKFTPEIASNKKLSWFSTSDNILKVDENGLLTAVSEGDAIVVIKTTDDSNIEKRINVKVTPPPVLATKISLDWKKITMNVGGTTSVIADIDPYNAANRDVAWSSDNPSIATVDNNGKITGVAVGEVNIYAKTVDGTNLSDSVKIIVEEPGSTDVSDNEMQYIGNEAGITIITDSVNNIVEDEKDILVKDILFYNDSKLLKNDLNLGIDETVKINAVAIPTSAAILDVIWEVEDNSIAEVDDEGNITGISAGTTAIFVSATDDSNIINTIIVNVKKDVEKIVLKNAKNNTISIKKNKTKKIKYQLITPDKSKKTVKWTSSNKKIASVTKKGKVTAKKKGSTVIKLTITSKKGLKLTKKIKVVVK